MYDIVTFGSAVRDAFFYSKDFKSTKDKDFITGKCICFNLGSKIEVDDVVFEVGGGAVNSSVAFSKLGLNADCVAQIGDDVAGQEILKRLKEEKVDSRFCLKDNKKKEFNFYDKNISFAVNNLINTINRKIKNDR